MDYLIDLDRRLFLYLNNNLHYDFLNTFFSFMTYRWNAVIPVIFLLVYLIYKEKTKSWYLILGLVLAVVFADQLTSSVFKPLFGRLRPCKDLSGVYYWTKKHGWRLTDDLHRYKSSFSFVSGHSANPAAIATFLYFYYPKSLWIFAPIAFLIAYSRIHVGVHYPADIIGGIIVGIFCGFLAKYCIELLRRKVQKDV